MSKVKSEPKKRGRSLDEFRAAHDKSFIVPKRIRDALNQLGDSWEYEIEFLRRCNLGTNELAEYRDQFEADHVVLVSSRSHSTKRIWVGSKELAETLRQMV